MAEVDVLRRCGKYKPARTGSACLPDDVEGDVAVAAPDAVGIEIAVVKGKDFLQRVCFRSRNQRSICEIHRRIGASAYCTISSSARTSASSSKKITFRPPLAMKSIRAAALSPAGPSRWNTSVPQSGNIILKILYIFVIIL